MPRTKTRELRLSPGQVGDFFTPARLEIYEGFQLGGPATIADLARRLGRAADSLYYHVRKLVELGVIEQLEDDSPDPGVVGQRGRTGAVYGVVAQVVTMRLEPGSKPSRDAWVKGAAAVLRLADRNVRAAVESGTARTEGAERDLLVKRSKVRLTREQLMELNRHLDGIQELLDQHADNERGDRYAVNLVMAPLDTSEPGSGSTKQEKGS